ncbi:MAG: hypothetical protein R2755_30440 [Acidimicrobiales bacterium]
MAPWPATSRTSAATSSPGSPCTTPTRWSPGLAEAGIRASAFSAGSIAPDLFPTTDAGVEVIVAPEDRAEALRIAEAFAAEAADAEATDAGTAPPIETGRRPDDWEQAGRVRLRWSTPRREHRCESGAVPQL